MSTFTLPPDPTPIEPGRIEFDNYATCPEIADEIVAWHRQKGLLSSNDWVLDPCAGEGNFAAALVRGGARALAVELRPTRAALERVVGASDRVQIADALALPYWPSVPVVTNPPFSKTREFIDLYARNAAAPRPFSTFLQRLNFQAPKPTKGRSVKWWTSWCPAHIVNLSKRPDFVATCHGTKSKKGCDRRYLRGTTGLCCCGGRIGAGTDMTDYAFYVFLDKPTPRGETRLDWLD